jgi:hypothetical protein
MSPRVTAPLLCSSIIKGGDGGRDEGEVEDEEEAISSASNGDE